MMQLLQAPFAVVHWFLTVVIVQPLLSYSSHYHMRKRNCNLYFQECTSRIGTTAAFPTLRSILCISQRSVYRRN
ncbi:hypothetical protein V1522DRAFT_414196 [Lipomyces starkeyi]